MITIVKYWLTRLLVAVSAFASLASAASTITYFHNDLLGSPIAATNSSGQVIWRENYRPYGERLTNDANSASNKVWYTSRRQDADTGLVYMGARYYDPVVGRFMGLDPKGFSDANLHSFNRYAYANSNPLRFRDPDGEDAIDDAGAALAKWWDGSIAGFRSDSPGEAVNRVVSALPAEAGVIGAVGVIGMIGKEGALAGSVKQAYEAALAGGSHAGFLEAYASKPLAQIERGIASLEKNVAEHMDKIANPAAYAEKWGTMSVQEQAGLIKHWERDMLRNQEQANVLKGLAEAKGAAP